MKYIIMCGGYDYVKYFPDTPRQLYKINGEVIIERTIRLLKECGVTDINITSMDRRFENLGANFIEYDSSKLWYDCFYPVDEPVCYLFGDVYYSYSAIYKIVNAETDSIEYFATTKCRVKRHNEPLAFKVVDTKKFQASIKTCIELLYSGIFRRCSSWELWQVIKNTKYRIIDFTNYVAIDDYSCDIDRTQDIEKMESKLSNQTIMIHCVPERLWYVQQYIIPSLEDQFISNIKVYIDTNKDGNLKSCLKSFESLPDNGYTWHIQDDIIISKRFRYTIDTTKYDIVCGFCPKRDYSPAGEVYTTRMWLSMPCIKIPNKLAKEFVQWVNNKAINNKMLNNRCISKNKGDDTLFRIFMTEKYQFTKVMNLNPNIVNHIDYLLGGSISNTKRDEVTRITSKYWDEDYLIEELENNLGGNNNV